MRRTYKGIMAVIMAVIFVFSNLSAFAALSPERVSRDYRNMTVMNRQGTPISKPTAQFSAKRIVNGEIRDAVVSYADYDCGISFPTLTCYVGDTLAFEDLSHDNNQNGHIVEWDWQYFGSLGDNYQIYDYNIVNSTSLVLGEPGTTTFFLCVKNDTRPKTGCCDPWSENGNHQTVGKNRWFPNGAYWYFTAITVVVKPAYEAIVHVQCWDAQNDVVFYEGNILAGQILNEDEVVNATTHITDWDGYSYSGWRVQLPDGTLQYDGTDRDVAIGLVSWMPEKYLIIEYYPYVDTEVEVRYWDSGQNQILHTEQLYGEKVTQEQETTVTAVLTPPVGYQMNGWNVQLPDGTIQYTGSDGTTNIQLNRYIPKKYLNVECSPVSNTRLIVKYIDEETTALLRSETIPGSEVHGDETVTVTASLEDIPGYVITGWRLLLSDQEVEQTGLQYEVNVSLSEQQPVKTLEVSCLALDPGNGDDGNNGNDGNGNGNVADDGNDPEELPEPTITVMPNGLCNGIIEWTETDSHRVRNGSYSNGRPRYRTCHHTFAYRSVLSANAAITPDTFKSGYGFEISVSYSVQTSLVSSSGECSSWGRDRAPLVQVEEPTTATVYIPWDMHNRLGSQSKTITMEKSGGQTFLLPVSNVSESGARKIYTPVELPGTEEEPVTHEFEIYISGGGIPNAEFCQKLIGRITINGDMYSDDFSGAD